MTIQERKTKVAQLMDEQAKAWGEVYKGEIETIQERKNIYHRLRIEIDEKIDSLIPDSERLSICLSGVAVEGVSHYDIEDSLQTVFKSGEGVQYDAESGHFWMYVKPTLVQKVLRHIDYHFPGKIDLVVEHNRWGANPWFQNWTQAQRYLETVVGA